LSRPNRLPPGLIVLTVAVAALRWETRARLFYNWDSVQYALGIGHYDLRLHQPHPPGSYYYVLAGRLLNGLTGDPHAALLLISAAVSALTILALFALGREMGGEWAGWWAAALGATSPLFWFYGSVGLNYSSDGLFATLTGLYSLRLWRGDARSSTAAIAGACLGAAGGFRPTSVVFLLPVWVLGLARLARGGPRGHPGAAALSAAIAGLLTLGWLLPTAVAAGGLRDYLRLSREMNHVLQSTAVWAVPSPWLALKYAGTTHRRCLESTLGGVWLALPFALLALLRAAGRRRLPAAEVLFWALWILPAAVFYLLAHFNSPGYTLVYAPAIVALAAGALAKWTTRRPEGTRGTATTGAIIFAAAANAALFWYGFPWASPRMGQRAISRPEIAQHDAYWAAFRDYLDRRYRPGEVRILASGTSTEGLRAAEALLPDRAGDVYQVVGHLPLLELPESIRALPFLHFCTAEQALRDPRPVVAVWRTSDDLAYHRNTFHSRLPSQEIGGGFRVGVVKASGTRVQGSGRRSPRIPWIYARLRSRRDQASGPGGISKRAGPR
jgi:4-amino-4-deoxy-L-arabinose transferase-like glycosyltransferase